MSRHKHRYRASSRDAAYQKTYGITLDEYNAMFARQRGKCAICGDGSGKALCVDHDHQTGTVRELLCSRCNAGIGFFLDDPIRLQAATAYVERWQS